VGTVKPTYIKKLAKQLLREVPDFTDDFDVNKKIVEEYTNIESKGIRNRIAGYITHKKKGKVSVSEL
jgi:small subunit ribosomal protein S17e